MSATVALTTHVDHSALRTNQACIILFVLAAYALDAWPLVAFVAAVMLLGTVIPSAGLFKALYSYALKPTGLARPDVRPDDPAPHRFAQGVGGVVMLVATLALVAGWSTTGWILAGVVVALASLNLFAGICVGCLLYLQLGRLGVPGFAGHT